SPAPVAGVAPFAPWAKSARRAAESRRGETRSASFAPPASNAGAVPASAAPAWGSGVPTPVRAEAPKALRNAGRVAYRAGARARQRPRALEGGGAPRPRHRLLASLHRGIVAEMQRRAPPCAGLTLQERFPMRAIPISEPSATFHPSPAQRRLLRPHHLLPLVSGPRLPRLARRRLVRPPPHGRRRPHQHRPPPGRPFLLLLEGPVPAHLRRSRPRPHAHLARRRRQTRPRRLRAQPGRHPARSCPGEPVAPPRGPPQTLHDCSTDC